jgi:hypothetical protein
MTMPQDVSTKCVLHASCLYNPGLFFALRLDRTFLPTPGVAPNCATELKI